MSQTRVLKTHEIISMKESELVTHIKQMSLEELEFYVKEIMTDMGADSYPAVMSQVMKTLEADDTSASKFEIVQKAIEEALPNKAYLSDIYARLAALVMSIIARKFQALL